MEMDRTCPTKRPSVTDENSSALGPRRQEKEGKTKKIMEKSTLKAMLQTWGSITKLVQD